MKTREKRAGWGTHLCAIIAVIGVGLYFGHRPEVSVGEPSFGTYHFRAPDELVPPSIDDQMTEPRDAGRAPRETPLGGFRAWSKEQPKSDVPIYREEVGSSIDVLLGGANGGRGEAASAPPRRVPPTAAGSGTRSP